MTDIIDEFISNFIITDKDIRDLSAYIDRLEQKLRSFFFGEERNILLKFKEKTLQKNAIKSLSGFGSLHIYRNFDYACLRCKRESFNDFFQWYKAGRIPYEAYPSQPRFIPFAIKSCSYEGLWNISMIGADRININSRNCIVAIIDSGIQMNHPDLADSYIGGYDFVENKKQPLDKNGHGTHVAGIVSGKKTGVSDSSIIAYRVLDADGFGDEADILKAIDKAIDDRVDIINMSLGSPYYSIAEHDACMAAAGKGIIICAAAGNESRGYSYPASYDCVVSIAAVDKNKRHAEFSNINDMIDISCPGVNIYSTYFDGYETLSGTSMASPHAAACFAIAKVVSRNTGSLEDMIKDTCEKIGDNDFKKYGYGLLRIDEFVRRYNAFKSLYFKG